MNAVLAIKALAGMTLAFSLGWWVMEANRQLAVAERAADRIVPSIILLTGPTLGATLLLGNLGFLVSVIRLASFALFLGALLALVERGGETRDAAMRGIWIVIGATLALRILGIGR